MNVLLIGCGRMGSAMVRGWKSAHRVLVFDPQLEAVPRGAEQVDTLEAVKVEGDLAVVLAIKPQRFASLGEALRPLAERDALFVSIMAGITLDGLSTALLGSGRVVRTMPNSPAAIGKGISAAVAGAGLRDGDLDAVDELLAPTGALVWLDDEAQIDAVTAVSGSGPAYFFRFTEALAEAGIAEGLPPELAMQLARATLSGAGALADTDPVALDELRRQVTSPGGTTAAGLAAMDADNAIDRLARAIVEAAAARSRELAG